MLQLRNERQKRGWSLMEVGAKTMIPPTTLSEIERGMRYCYPGWRARIVKAFKQPEELLFREIENE